jgi:hypothetical protein
MLAIPAEQLELLERIVIDVQRSGSSCDRSENEIPLKPIASTHLHALAGER